MSKKLTLSDVTALVDLLSNCFGKVNGESDLLFALSTTVLIPLRVKLLTKMYGAFPNEGIKLKLKSQEVMALIALKPHATPDQDNAIVRLVQQNVSKK